MVVSIVYKAKISFMNLRFVIPVHFLVEFLFTLTFMELSTQDMAFRLTLSLHGLTDCMFASCLLFRREDAERIFPNLFAIWSLSAAVGGILYYPLDLVISSSIFVLPMDVLIFLASIATFRRTTHPRAKLGAAWLVYHMFSGMIIFTVYLAKSSFGYPLIINGAHILILLYIWRPIALMSDEELVSHGITPPLGRTVALASDAPASPAAADGSVAVAVKENAAPAVVSGDYLSPKRLENLKHTLIVDLAITSVFFVALLVGIFASRTTSILDLLDSPVKYYHPGEIGAIP